MTEDRKNMFGEWEVSSATAKFLRECSEGYSILVDKLSEFQKVATPEAVLAWIEMVAGFAAMNHPGVFADGKIENVALEIGRTISPSMLRRYGSKSFRVKHSQQRSNVRRIVHIATVVLEVGGHSRAIMNWARKDTSSTHSLILTRQGKSPIPSQIEKAIRESGGEIISLVEEAPILSRALELRTLAPEMGDIGLLHVSPNDIVPVVAFAEGTNVPVGFVNHADQLFWVGSTVSDSTVNLRDVSIPANQELRHTRNDTLVPIPLQDIEPASDLNVVRQSIGITGSHPVLLTVGRALKFAPSQRQNFFETVSNILRQSEMTHLYVVGLSETDRLQIAAAAGQDRIHFVGEISDPRPYQQCADAYLEGFPFGSQTALLESVLPGIPCVRAIKPMSPLLTASDDSINPYAPVPSTEEQYVSLALNLLQDSGLRARLGGQLRTRVRRDHVLETWNDSAGAAYTVLGGLKHSAVNIPEAEPQNRTVDLAISEYHSTRYRGADTASQVAEQLANAMFSVAYTLRQRGEYRDSFSALRLAHKKQLWSMRSSIFAAKLIPHSVMKMVQNRKTQA